MTTGTTRGLTNPGDSQQGRQRRHGEGQRGDEEQDRCSSPDPDRIEEAMAAGAAWGTSWTLDYDPAVQMNGSGVWGELGGD